MGPDKGVPLPLPQSLYIGLYKSLSPKTLIADKASTSQAR